MFGYLINLSQARVTDTALIHVCVHMSTIREQPDHADQISLAPESNAFPSKPVLFE
jgi:hypothetical protein